MHNLPALTVALIGLFATVTFVPWTPGVASRASPVSDPIGVVRIAGDEPIIIGYWLWKGSSINEEDSRRGIELAVDERDGRLLGHSIRLLGDLWHSTEIEVPIVERLLANGRTLAVVGPTSRRHTDVGPPLLWNAGVVSVSPGSPTPDHVAPDRSPGYDGLLFVRSGEYARGAFAGRYAREVLRVRRAAMISYDRATWEAQGFLRAFNGLGGNVVVETVRFGDADIGTVLQRISISAPELIYYDLHPDEVAPYVQQTKYTAKLARGYLMGPSWHLSEFHVEKAGYALKGLLSTGPNRDESKARQASSRYQQFLERYERKYRRWPWNRFGYASGHDATPAYDATAMILSAIERVARRDEAGTTHIGRRALRDALYATKRFPGLTGELTCNRSGECGHPNVAIYQIVSTTWKEGENPKRVYP